MNRITESTYILTADEIVAEYQQNKELRRRLESGSFIYVEEMLILNDMKFIDYANKYPLITEDTHANLSRYAISFDIVFLPLLTGKLTGFDDSEKNRKIKNFDPDRNSLLPDNLGDVVTRQQELYDFFASLPRGMGSWEMMGKLIEREGCDLGDFEYKTCLNERQYFDAKRSLKDPSKVKNIPSKPTITAFAAGFGLTRKITDILLEAAGKSFSLASREDVCYSIVLDTMITVPIDIKNEWLVQNGVPPLGARTD